MSFNPIGSGGHSDNSLSPIGAQHGDGPGASGTPIVTSASLLPRASSVGAGTVYILQGQLGATSDRMVYSDGSHWRLLAGGVLDDSLTAYQSQAMADGASGLWALAQASYGALSNEPNLASQTRYTSPAPLLAITGPSPVNSPGIVNGEAHVIHGNSFSIFAQTTTTFTIGATAARSLEVWASFDSVPSAGTYSTDIGASTTGAQIGFANDGSGNGIIIASVSKLVGDFGGHPLDFVVSGHILPNTVHHIVLVWDGTKQSLYVDGALVAGPTAPADNPTATAPDMTIGFNQAWGAKVQDLAFYVGTALTADQIANHYTLGL